MITGWSQLCEGRLWDGIGCVKDSSKAEFDEAVVSPQTPWQLNLINSHVMKYLCVLGEVTSLSPQQLLLVYVTHLFSKEDKMGLNTRQSC